MLLSYTRVVDKYGKPVGLVKEEPDGWKPMFFIGSDGNLYQTLVSEGWRATPHDLSGAFRARGAPICKADRSTLKQRYDPDFASALLDDDGDFLPQRTGTVYKPFHIEIGRDELSVQ